MPLAPPEPPPALAVEPPPEEPLDLPPDEAPPTEPPPPIEPPALGDPAPLELLLPPDIELEPEPPAEEFPADAVGWPELPAAPPLLPPGPPEGEPEELLDDRDDTDGGTTSDCGSIGSYQTAARMSLAMRSSAARANCARATSVRPLVVAFKLSWIAQANEPNSRPDRANERITSNRVKPANGEWRRSMSLSRIIALARWRSRLSAKYRPSAKLRWPAAPTASPSQPGRASTAPA
jgi:hypothetical protein